MDEKMTNLQEEGVNKKGQKKRKMQGKMKSDIKVESSRKMKKVRQRVVGR